MYQFKAAHIDIAMQVNGKKGITINTAVRHLFFLSITLSTAVLELAGAPVPFQCLTIMGAVSLPYLSFRDCPKAVLSQLV